MKFSYKLQELRKGSGMSQEEFAELLGVSRQSVSKWESGKGYPEIDKLIFISNYFNTSLDLLLKDTSDYDSNPSIKSSKDSKKTKHTISLTKPIDTNDSFNNQPNYVSDPLPNKKKIIHYKGLAYHITQTLDLLKIISLEIKNIVISCPN